MAEAETGAAVPAGGSRGTCTVEVPFVQASWLETFFFGTAQRKNPGAELSLSPCEAASTPAAASAALAQALTPPMPPLLLRITAPLADESLGAFTERWQKLVSAALRKVETDDLGDMDAAYLSEAIPEEGRAKLASLQRELSVKVVFCAASGHIVLAGGRAKLSKKCFELKNVLAHYHWRLSGHDRLLTLDQK